MEKLRDYLTKHGEKPSHFADRAGCSAGSISDVLKARRPVGKALAKKIVAACGGEISYDDLMKGSEDE